MHVFRQETHGPISTTRGWPKHSIRLVRLARVYTLTALPTLSQGYVYTLTACQINACLHPHDAVPTPSRVGGFDKVVVYTLERCFLSMNAPRDAF